MAKVKVNEVLQWSINGSTTVVATHAGKEVFRRDVAEYPKSVRDYAMAIRCTKKLRDTYALEKDKKVNHSEALVLVQTMDKQLMTGAWNTGGTGTKVGIPQYIRALKSIEEEEAKVLANIPKGNKEIAKYVKSVVIPALGYDGHDKAYWLEVQKTKEAAKAEKSEQ